MYVYGRSHGEAPRITGLSPGANRCGVNELMISVRRPPGIALVIGHDDGGHAVSLADRLAGFATGDEHAFLRYIGHCIGAPGERPGKNRQLADRPSAPAIVRDRQPGNRRLWLLARSAWCRRNRFGVAAHRGGNDVQRVRRVDGNHRLSAPRLASPSSRYRSTSPGHRPAGRQGPGFVRSLGPDLPAGRSGTTTVAVMSNRRKPCISIHLTFMTGLFSCREST